jgi:hypothetical protein
MYCNRETIDEQSEPSYFGGLNQAKVTGHKDGQQPQIACREPAKILFNGYM